MPKTIIFDLSEVVLSGLRGTEVRIAEKLGIEVSNKDVFEFQKLHDFFCGRISEDQLWCYYIWFFGWRLEIKDLKELVRSNFRRIPQTQRVIDDLRRHGHRLGLLSVHGREWVEHLRRRFNYEAPFQYKSYSCETGLCKPQPEAFLEIADRMRSNPADCLLIDDWQANVDAAAKLGFDTHLFRSAAELRSNLVSRGLLLR